MRIAAARVALTALIAADLLSVDASAMASSGPGGGAIPAQIRIIALWSEADAALPLFVRGLRLRLRATDEGGGELTLKAAVDAGAPVAATLPPANGGKGRHEVHGDRVTAAVAPCTRLDASAVKALRTGRAPLTAVLGPAQVHTPHEATQSSPLPADVRVPGPIEVSTYRARERPYDVASV